MTQPQNCGIMSGKQHRQEERGMAYWNSRGLRGSDLEEIINFTNAQYRRKGLALFQKIPTPITPVEVDNQKHTITLAYFDQSSTVDYMGVVQGIPVCFDAKETAQKHLPLQNIHEHQLLFMEDFQAQKGIAFLLVYFSAMDEYYFLPIEVLRRYWQAAQTGGRKSIPYAAFERRYEIRRQRNGMLHYLEAIAKYLEATETEGREDTC